MEDSHVLEVTPDGCVLAVFDGHGGAAVAKLGAARFLELEAGHGPAAGLRDLAQAAAAHTAGACAVAARLRGSRLEVANVGDAELALVDAAGAVTVLTQLHRLDDSRERARVLAAGALVDGPYVVDRRTGDGLMPTRSLGDAAFRHIGITAVPFESAAEFEGGWIVAACDGLWDVVAAAELPALLRGLESAALAAEALAVEALGARASSDNLTVVVVRR